MKDLLNTTELLELLPIGRSTFYNLRRDGDFFNPVRLSKRRIAWRRSDAEAWVALR